MAFPAGGAVGRARGRGAQGGARGRGPPSGRGSSGAFRGRGRAAGRGALVSDGRGPSKVPAFPVVSRTPSAASAQIHHSSEDDDDEDDDAPPVSRPARLAEEKPLGTPRSKSVGASSASSAGGAHRNGPRRVITTVTEGGTELPKKLNNKVFIDGLPYNYDSTGKASLEEEMMQFALAWKVGKPLRLIKRPGQGFGFLVLQSPNSVPTAVRVLNGRKFLGRTLRVEEPKPKDLEAMHDVAGMREAGKDSFSRQVLLSDLAKVAQPEIIREVLRDVAPQLEKRLEAIKMTSRNRKAFLTFETEADVKPALTFLDGFHLLGRKISASPAAAPGSLPYSRGAAPRTAAPSMGTVEFAEEEDDEETIIPLGAVVPPQEAKTKPVKSTSPAQGARSARGSNFTGHTSKYNLLDKGPSEVYVGNVTDEITADHLRQHFSSCGKINRCEVLVHPETHMSTGIARVEFALPAYAACAQETLHGSRLRGHVLRVDRGEQASAPLAVDLPPSDPVDDYDEDAYLARYGVKDKKAYFKGTSFAKEMGADGELTDDRAGRATRASSKRARDGKPAAGAKQPRLEATKATRKAAAAASGDNCFVVSGAVGGGADIDSEEEHFYDVDTVQAGGKSAKGKGKGKGKVKSVSSEAAPKKHNSSSRGSTPRVKKGR